MTIVLQEELEPEKIFWCFKKEAYEEAGLKKEQLNNVKLVGTLNYNWKNSTYTLRRDTLYLFIRCDVSLSHTV